MYIPHICAMLSAFCAAKTKRKKNCTNKERIKRRIFELKFSDGANNYRCFKRFCRNSAANCFWFNDNLMESTSASSSARPKNRMIMRHTCRILHQNEIRWRWRISELGEMRNAKYDLKKKKLLNDTEALWKKDTDYVYGHRSVQNTCICVLYMICCRQNRRISSLWYYYTNIYTMIFLICIFNIIIIYFRSHLWASMVLHSNSIYTYYIQHVYEVNSSSSSAIPSLSSNTSFTMSSTFRCWCIWCIRTRVCWFIRKIYTTDIPNIHLYMHTYIRLRMK